MPMPSLYRTRPAYRFTVENSVYVAPDMQRRGIGSALLKALIDACTARGFRQMIAVIGDSNQAASIGVHRALRLHRRRQLAQYRLQIRPLARHASNAADLGTGRDHGAARARYVPDGGPASANLH